MGEARKRFVDNREPKPELPGSTGAMRAMRDARLKQMRNEETYKHLPTLGRAR